MVNVDYVINLLKENGLPDRLVNVLGLDRFEDIEALLRENYGKIVYVRDNPFYFGAINLDNVCLLLIPNPSKERYEIFELEVENEKE